MFDEITIWNVFVRKPSLSEWHGGWGVGVQAVELWANKCTPPAKVQVFIASCSSCNEKFDLNLNF